MKLQEKRVEVEQHVRDQAGQQHQRQDRAVAQPDGHSLFPARIATEDQRQYDQQADAHQHRRKHFLHQRAHILHVLDLALVEGRLAVRQFGLLEQDQACAFRYDGI